ncbi:Transducin family protein / WD-40 repeat family protein isoform 2 [Hibiscus syriacus]|uniref:Transducin family protein / WD-40 repeat family protein isoform 2 n=1 Tax=Hibiscus syriacus TaxID=106335 RepID=A0A6A3BRC6_HIBSY|nr:Transducin family protein / WD-40 repeat family protein isoform 2 [Hibiscus syriacus]
MAVPISSEGFYLMRQKTCKKTRKKVKRSRSREKKPLDFCCGKWAHFGVPMLVSAGDDAKLFAYSAKDFTRFFPHDICPAPQRVPIQLVTSTRFNQTSFLLVQASCWLDVLTVQVPDVGSGPYGELFGYSDHIRSNLFALRRQAGQSTWTISKRQLPQNLPSAHSMVFTSDGSRLLIAGHDRKIYIVDLESSKLLDTFIPCCQGHEKEGDPLVTIGRMVNASNIHSSLKIPRISWGGYRLSFSHQSKSTSVVVYSARAMCSIDFVQAVDEDNESELVHEALLNLQGSLTKTKWKRLLSDGRQKESKQTG